MFIRVMLMLMFPILIGQCSAVGGMGEIQGHLPGSVYHSLRAVVFQQCRELCLYATQCSSINYNQKRRELNSNMDNPGGYAKMDTKIKKKNKCSVNTCPGSNLCVRVFNFPDLCLTSLQGQKLATDNHKSLESSSALLQSSGIEAKQQVSTIDSDVMAISPSDVMAKHAPIKHRPPREGLTYTVEEKRRLKKRLASKKRKLVRCANFQLPFKEVRNTCTVPDMIRRDGGECQCETGFHYDPRKNKCVRRCRKYGTTLVLQSRLMCIGGHNNKQFRSSRVEKCIRACVKEKKFVCRSFDYWQSTCFLSKDTRADVKQAWSPWCGCVYYQRICA